MNQFWIKSRQKEQYLRTKHKDKQHSKSRKACSKINSLQFEENIFEQIYQSSLILLIFIKEKTLINITNLNNIREKKGKSTYQYTFERLFNAIKHFQPVKKNTTYPNEKKLKGSQDIEHKVGNKLWITYCSNWGGVFFNWT